MKDAVFQYVAFYNFSRVHQKLGAARLYRCRVEQFIPEMGIQEPQEGRRSVSLESTAGFGDRKGTGLPSDFNADIAVESRASNRRGAALLGGWLLIAGVIFLLAVNVGFARYALTGFLWIRTDGTVLSRNGTSTPTIQFATRDSINHQFKEDHILLCGGRRSICFIRRFSHGQVVPVVYDPGAPKRAFVYDWALFASVITWFTEAGAGLLLTLMMALLLAKKPLDVSIQLGRNP